MMVMMTCVAVLLGASVALPSPVVIVLARLVSQAIFLTMLLGVLHGKGQLRTFCVGGLVAASCYFLPELFSSRRGAEAVLEGLAESLLRNQGQPVLATGTRILLTSSARVIEFLFSVAALGCFSVWFRNRLDRWQSRTHGK